MKQIQILRFSQVREQTGFSKTTIDRLERAGKFPKRIKIGSRAVGWDKKSIDRWLNEKLGANQSEGGK